MHMYWLDDIYRYMYDELYFLSKWRTVVLSLARILWYRTRHKSGWPGTRAIADRTSHATPNSPRRIAQVTSRSLTPVLNYLQYLTHCTLPIARVGGVYTVLPFWVKLCPPNGHKDADADVYVHAAGVKSRQSQITRFFSAIHSHELLPSLFSTCQRATAELLFYSDFYCMNIVMRMIALTQGPPQ